MITILSHNIFWLQGVPFEPDMPGAPREDILDGLAQLYSRIGANVICIQEVQSSAAFDLIRSTLGMVGAYCPGRTLSQYGGASFWRSGSLLADSSSATDPPQRMWQNSEVGDETSGVVTVCNVHLPSARQLGREGAAVRRIEELAASIQSLPDVVLGDFNEPPGGAVTQFISRNGYQDAAVLMGRPDVPTSVGGSRGDQIWVRSDLRERVLEYGVLAKEDLAISLGEKVYLSDHVPLWVRLEAGGQREV